MQEGYVLTLFGLGGGGGGQEVPALTLSVNNFFDSKANVTKHGDFS